jgi:hypothetical protein
MKNFSDTIGNRTRDLPSCSAVLQPTAPPRASYLKCTEANDDVCYKIGCTIELLTKIRNLVFLLLLTDELDSSPPLIAGFVSL